MTLKNKAAKSTQELLQLLGFDVPKLTVSTKDEGMTVNITVPEKDSGPLIGYHGETSGALQNLLGQIINKDQDKWQRIILNINGYRDQREIQLKQMALNAAERALTTGDEIEMPYLTAAERRIIHLELTDRKDIKTYSEGEGSHRRLIIAPD